ncbi:MAG TPA: response regulator [Caulobacteraceae bacterium]|nr:response regulator [Caulobacteraceae bacterium]
MSESTRRSEPAAPRRETAPGESGKPNVLIVDEDPATRRVCAGYCDLFDHQSSVAKNLPEALSAMRSEPFDVVVLSVHMTGALDAVRAIRALPEPRGKAPIIGLAAVGKGEETQRWMSAGLAAVLAKPITARRLFQALSTAADGGFAGPRSWAPA